MHNEACSCNYLLNFQAFVHIFRMLFLKTVDSLRNPNKYQLYDKTCKNYNPPSVYHNFLESHFPFIFFFPLFWLDFNTFFILQNLGFAFYMNNNIAVFCHLLLICIQTF